MSDDKNRKSTQVGSGWESTNSDATRNATQIDMGWRRIPSEARSSTKVDVGWKVRIAEEKNDAQIDLSQKGLTESKRKVDELDEGWRSNNASTGRQATQVDVGWRSNNASTGRQATQVDAGWRSNNASTGRQATQVDAGWRSNNASTGRQATQVDAGWRSNNASTGRQVTQVDAAWRREISDTLNPESVMNSATANYFSSIDEFKNAVERLSELKSSTDIIYPVKRTISKAGGESIILLCSDPDGNDVVAKVYYEPINREGSSISSRAHVLEYMRTDEGKKYTLAVTEIGAVEFGESKYYFEIMPYCASTDLSDDGAYSFEQLVEITRQLNEALHSMHQAGIIHRDIKPENLYQFNGVYKLGDFGIARVGEQGRLNMTTTFKFTPGYAPPEATLYGYNESTDYYSLGVTLASLFEGRFVFEDMSYEMEMNAKQNERLPLTRVDPNREQLENLLNGLFRFSPKQRFGYEDVNRWLSDHNYTGGFREEWPKSFRLLNDEYRDEKSMFYGITKDGKHWEEAKSMLYSKFIEQFFMSFRTDLARSAQIADELYRTDNRDKGLSVFLKNLFAPGPIVWKGYTFNSLSDLSGKMVTTKTPTAYGELLQNHCISHWLSNTEGIEVDEKTINLVDSIEALSSTEPELACYWFGNSFTSVKALNICNHTVTNVEELIKALFSTPSVFYLSDGYQKLSNRLEGADLYGFLYSLGFKDIIEKEWENLKSCDLFNKICLLISMLDNIALKSGVSPTLIRRFFVFFGPVGIATYTKKLVDSNIYKPLDPEGKQVLGKILNFKAPTSGTVEELFRAFVPLVDSVDKLHNSLIENPHCILTGVYENKGVICTNLAGCFAFKIFDRVAPLGFNTWIETSGGGLKS